MTATGAPTQPVAAGENSPGADLPEVETEAGSADCGCRADLNPFPNGSKQKIRIRLGGSWSLFIFPIDQEKEDK
jgi:hypothetical protein